MNFNLDKSTVFLTLHGSHAYGLNTPESDYDFRGVACPPIGAFTSPFNHFEQSQGAHDFVEDIAKNKLPGFGPNDDTKDCTIFSIQKFVKLASDCNPNIIELLFMPDRCVLRTSEAWEYLVSHRDGFVSLKAKFTFSGYAFAQLKRITNHKKRGDNKPVKPTREAFGLPREKLGGTEFINSILHIQNDKSVVLGDELVERAKNEKRYNEAMREWKSYETWLKERNKKRAALEAKFGYDCKHASHLVRLLRMGEEILSTGKVNVDRTDIDAEELTAIKNNGIWSYEHLMEWTDMMDEKLSTLYSENPVGLSKKPAIKKIEKAYNETISRFYSTDR